MFIGFRFIVWFIGFRFTSSPIHQIHWVHWVAVAGEACCVLLHSKIMNKKQDFELLILILILSSEF